MRPHLQNNCINDNITINCIHSINYNENHIKNHIKSYKNKISAAVEPLVVAGCSARGGPHDADRPNANKKRSQPFRTPKTKNDLFPRA